MSRAWLLSFLLLPAAAAAQERVLDLPEAYRLALARSEEIAISGATYEEALANADEIFSRVKPRLTLIGTETLQDVPPGTGVSLLFLQRHREQGWVNLRQPLFSGFREFLAYRASKDLGRAAELSLERAKQLLYRDVARAYLDLLAAQDDIRIREALVSITRSRVGDLGEFRKVGRARASELLAAESQLALNLAQLESARASEQIAQFTLGFLTGLEERLALAPAPEPAPVPALDAALAKARARPDVESRREEASAAELSVKVASRARWPTVSLDANWYFQRPPGFTSEVKWDAAITGTLPLYGGGEIGSQTRQREARLRAKRAALSDLSRRAELEARSAHQRLASSVAVTAALDRAAALAEENAKAQSADYRLGQVTNLEVLG
ncbi:MAG: TolC family protein, partial [Elusimicrobia bacterium]|nr:TolC family protein [Elusimicrobiota bacterium]